MKHQPVIVKKAIELAKSMGGNMTRYKRSSL